MPLTAICQLTVQTRIQPEGGALLVCPGGLFWRAGVCAKASPLLEETNVIYSSEHLSKQEIWPLCMYKLAQLQSLLVEETR
jgi:hypothetical protein